MENAWDAIGMPSKSKSMVELFGTKCGTNVERMWNECGESE